MGTQLAQGGVVKAADGRFLDGAIHPFSLSVGPRMEGAYQAMLGAMPMAGHIKAMRLVGFYPWSLGKLRVVICQYSVKPIRQLLQHAFEELSHLFPLCLAIDPGMHKLDGAVDGHEQICLALPGEDLADVHMQVAYRSVFE